MAFKELVHFISKFSNAFTELFVVLFLILLMTCQVCSDILFILYISCLCLLLFLLSLATSISLIFSEHQLFVSFILSTVVQFSILLIPIHLFFTSFLLVDLDLFCSFSIYLRWKLFILLFFLLIRNCYSFLM